MCNYYYVGYKSYILYKNEDNQNRRGVKCLKRDY